MKKSITSKEEVSEKKFDLEERLIDYAVDVIRLVESLPETKTANHLGGQLLRSGTSPSLNYGEARGAESKNDFVHKMKVCLKELRESHNCLKIINKGIISEKDELVARLITESNELISIFVKSINTALKKSS
ncbi:MAG: four helix bundle protein [Bacteroidales bacterium]